MTWIRLVLMLYFFMVAHKAAYQTLSKAFLEVYEAMVEVLPVLQKYFSQRMRSLEICSVVLLPAPTHIHTHIHTHTRAHAHTHIHTRTHARTRTHTHGHTRTHARTRAHTHTHTHTYTRTHTNTDFAGIKSEVPITAWRTHLALT